MHLTFVTFNYQSADLEAEERNYLGHHVELAKRFPGLRQYYTGRLMKVAGKQPDSVRAAILAYDDAAAAASAMRSEVVPALIADTQAHLKDTTSTAVDAEDDRAVRFAAGGSELLRDGCRVRSRTERGTRGGGETLPRDPREYRATASGLAQLHYRQADQDGGD